MARLTFFARSRHIQVTRFDRPWFRKESQRRSRLRSLLTFVGLDQLTSELINTCSVYCTVHAKGWVNLQVRCKVASFSRESFHLKANF